MALDGSYLDIDEFAARTIAPASLVHGTFYPEDMATERAAWTTFVEAQLKIETSKINARLRKRYDMPLPSPVPEIVCGWLTARVTLKLYQRRGWDPSDAQAENILAAAQEALDEQKEAADAVDGLYDLPLRQDTSSSGLAKPEPLVYAEASPYDWLDAQREALR